jgi:DNA-binding XRE family transcriptional regulator
MQINLSNFPFLLKQVRAQLHLSQKELANELGASYWTVNRWENQQTEPLKLALRPFEKFCKQKMADGSLSLTSQSAL